MSEWVEVRLADLCERITVGHVGKMADRYVERGIPYLRSKDVRPFAIDKDELLCIDPAFHTLLKKSALRAGDVVVVRTGYPGTAAVVPEDLDGSNCSDLVIITPSARLNPDFLAGLFNSSWGRTAVSGNLVGSAQQHFNVGAAKALRVRVPDRRTQDGIAAVLTSLGGLIDNNQRRIALLDQMARAIYREWFVQLRYPGHEREQVVDSPTGRIPAGWNRVELRDAARIVMGQSPKSEHYNESGHGLPFHQGVSNFGSNYPHHRLYCSVDGRLAEPGDHLVSVRAPVGRINRADQRLVIGRGLAAVHSRRGSNALLGWQLRHVFHEEDIMGGGTIFKAITKAELARIAVLEPDDRLRRAAERALEPLDALIRNLTFSMRTVSALRDTLLTKLVTGAIDVSRLDLEALVEEATT